MTNMEFLKHCLDIGKIDQARYDKGVAKLQRIAFVDDHLALLLANAGQFRIGERIFDHQFPTLLKVVKYEIDWVNKAS